MKKNSQQMHLWTIPCENCRNEVSPQDGSEIFIDYHSNKAFFCNDCIDKAAAACEYCHNLVIRPMRTAVGNENWCDVCRDKHAAHCSNCDSYFPEEDKELVDGDTWCETCVAEDAHYCDRHEEYRSTSLTEVRTDRYRNTSEYWCEECKDEFAFWCEDCDKYYSNEENSDYFIDLENRTVCSSCYDDRYFTCDGCNYSMSSERYVRDGYCNGCAPEGILNANNIENSDANIFSPQYGLKYDPEVLTNTTKPYIGVEFETLLEDPSDTDVIDEVNSLVRFNGKFGIIKEDASLEENGFEIVTVPMLLEDQKVRWKDFFDSGVNNNFENYSGAAGIHIHLNRNSLTNVGLARLLFLVYGQKENKKFTEFIAERKPNTYWKNNPQNIKNYYKDREKQKSRFRSEAVNLQNNNTIEFRIFNSVQDKEKFYKNIEYVDAVYNFCNNEIFIRPTWQNFVDYVKVNESKYPHLVSFIFNNIIRDESNKYVFKNNSSSTYAEIYINNIFHISSNFDKIIYYKQDHDGGTVFCTKDGVNWWMATENGIITPLCGEVPQGDKFKFLPIERLSK